MRAEDESFSNLRTLKGKRHFFYIVYDVSMTTKRKITVNFLALSSGKFRQSWQSANNFLLNLTGYK